VLTFDSNLRLFRLVWTWRLEQLFNGAGDGGPWPIGNSPRFRLSSAILADLDMRGSAISVSTLVSIALLSTFSRLLLFIFS
jgi:hypothetical protein